MLLMIPGPVEVSPAVVEAFSGPPPGHLAPHVIDAHGRALERLRELFLAGPASQPFAVPGSGTIAMEMAVANLVEAGDQVIVVNTGYFSDRISEMARRRGADVREVRAAPGDVPAPDDLERAFADGEASVVFVTHVDTSTGVRVDPEPICRRARETNALTVFDGVCATGAERFEMENWGADVYLTASQKAIGLPPGLALMVASPEAIEKRHRLRDEVPMALDWDQWLPIMQAYEDRRPSYFSTPATNHIMALDVSLGEILQGGMEAVFQRHQSAAEAMRRAWASMGLELLSSPGVTANTMSAVKYPDGSGPLILETARENGVALAGGLYPGLKQTYFRVGHMGYSTTRPDHLEKTVRAVAAGLDACGLEVDADAAVDALDERG